MARKRRQLVLMGPQSKGAPAAPLGSRRQVAEALSRFNTAPDGGPASDGGTEFLYGPGMVVEIPTTTDMVNQAIASLNDEDIAWPVLMKMCKELGWKLMDIESGRVFG